MSEVLIRVPVERSGRGTWARSALLSTTTAATIVIMVFTGAAEIAQPDTVVDVVGIEDRARLLADHAVSFRDGTMARAMEQRIKLQSPVRRAVSPWWSAVLLRFFEDAPEDLIVGSDGVLFLRQRAQLSEKTLRDGPTVIANYLYALGRRAATRGVRLISLPLPRKSVIFEDEMPGGMDPAPELEHQLYAALEARGGDYIDLLKAWKDLDPVQVYNSKDSHWAIPAQVEVCKALVAKYPELRRDDHQSTHVAFPSPSQMELLRIAGIPGGHPARGLFHPETHGTIGVEDRDVARRVMDEEFAGDVVITGTSFVMSSSLHAILTVVTRAYVESRARNGGAMNQTLCELIADRRRSGVFPSVVVEEFPVHQIQFAVGGASATRRVFGFLFTLLDVDDLTEFERTTRPAPPVLLSGDRLRLGQGTLVSSGDGALSLEVVATSDHDSIWIVETPGLRLDVRLQSLGARAVIPVMDGPQWNGTTSAYPLDSRFSDASISIRPVVEGSLDPGADIVLGAAAGSRGYVSTEPVSIDASETFLFRWSEPCAELKIELVGRDRDGAPVKDTYTFVDPQVASAAIAPRRLGGGTLTGVSILGPDASVTLHRVRRPVQSR